jgi:hypothetical protein
VRSSVAWLAAKSAMVRKPRTMPAEMRKSFMAFSLLRGGASGAVVTRRDT